MPDLRVRKRLPEWVRQPLIFLRLLEFHQLEERRGYGGFELEPLAGDGMREAETEGMKTEAVDGRHIVLVAVHRVMNHRVFQVA